MAFARPLIWARHPTNSCWCLVQRCLEASENMRKHEKILYNSLRCIVRLTPWNLAAWSLGLKPSIVNIMTRKRFVIEKTPMGHTHSHRWPVRVWGPGTFQSMGPGLKARRVPALEKCFTTSYKCDEPFVAIIWSFSWGRLNVQPPSEFVWKWGSQPSNYVVSSPQNEEDSRNSAGLSLKYALRQQGNIGTNMVPWISKAAVYHPYV